MTDDYDLSGSDINWYMNKYLAVIKLLTGKKGEKFVEERISQLEAMQRGNKEAPCF